MFFLKAIVPLYDNIQMQLWVLIIFKMPAHAFNLGYQPEDIWYSKSTVVHLRSHSRIDFFGGSVQTARSENADTSWSQILHDLPQNRFLFCQWEMPNAIPGRNEVVRSRKIPFADIGMVEIDVRMTAFRQFNHAARKIETLGIKAVVRQKVNNSPATSTTNIKRSALLFEKGDGSLMLHNAITSLK